MFKSNTFGYENTWCIKNSETSQDENYIPHFQTIRLVRNYETSNI